MNKQESIDALELKLTAARKANDIVGLIALCHEMEELMESNNDHIRAR